MHLTDNFGFSDEHLYPGQGNVPFKQLFEALKEGNPNFDKDVKKDTLGYSSRKQEAWLPSFQRHSLVSKEH